MADRLSEKQRCIFFTLHGIDELLNALDILYPVLCFILAEICRYRH